MNIKDKKIAIVHDFLNQYGGAEKVLEVLCEIFPEAPIYTLLYDKKGMRGKFENREIHTSFLQKFPKFLRKKPMYLLPFLSTAPETFDLRDYDLVISSSGAWSKGIVTKLDTIHIAYIHSPMRFAWDYNERYLKEERKEKLAFLIRPILSYLRLWDKLASDRPDYLIANSRYTQSRIKKYYRRDSQVIYPPVFIGHSDPPAGGEESCGTGSFTSVQDDISKKYFLIVSRLSAYKKIDKAIEAFNKLELPLVIVGTGKQEKYLKKIAKDNIKFLGFQKDEDLAELYKNARAFIFPGVDDFGMAPVEAMMYGVPVIAIKEGGAVEIIEEGKTGEFSQSQKAEVIADAVRRFCENEKNYDKEYIIKSVERFSKERFKKEIEGYIEKIISNF
jgi:glycosyltransferase involved in cell wall biosynthesis